MNTDQLIDQLVAEVKPVRRLVDPHRRSAMWVAAALVCVTLGVLYFGLRRDLDPAIHSSVFWLRIALLVSTMWLGITAAFRLAVPGRDPRAWSRWWPLAVLGGLVALAAGELVTGAVTGADLGSPMRAWTCVRKIAFVGAVPAVLSLALIRRAVPLEPQWAAVLAIVASAAAGALTSELACPIRAPWHILLWHALPVLASVGLGLAAGSVLLWWMRRGRSGSRL